MQMGQVGAGAGMFSAPSQPPAAASSISVVAGTIAPKSDSIGADISGESVDWGGEWDRSPPSGVNGEGPGWCLGLCAKTTRH